MQEAANGWIGNNRSEDITYGFHEVTTETDSTLVLFNSTIRSTLDAEDPSAWNDLGIFWYGRKWNFFPNTMTFQLIDLVVQSIGYSNANLTQLAAPANQK